jgi:hypothetical protein
VGSSRTQLPAPDQVKGRCACGDAHVGELSTHAFMCQLHALVGCTTEATVVCSSVWQVMVVKVAGGIGCVGIVTAKLAVNDVAAKTEHAQHAAWCCACT